MATYEDANRSGREICTMRHLGSVAMDNFLRELTCRAEEEPIMANQEGPAPRRPCRLVYFSGGVDRLHGKETNARETSERSAVFGASSREFKRRHFSTQADRKPTAK